MSIPQPFRTRAQITRAGFEVPRAYKVHSFGTSQVKIRAASQARFGSLMAETTLRKFWSFLGLWLIHAHTFIYVSGYHLSPAQQTSLWTTWHSSNKADSALGNFTSFARLMKRRSYPNN